MKMITTTERIQNGVLEYYKIMGPTLILLSSIFAYFIQPRSEVQDLEDNNLIDSIEEVSPLLRTVNDNLPAIIACVLTLPLALLAVFKAKSKYATQETSNNFIKFIEPVFPKNELVIKPSVTAKDKTITAKTLATWISSDKALLESGYLELQEPINKITIKGCFYDNDPLNLVLQRKGETIASHEINLIEIEEG